MKKEILNHTTKKMIVSDYDRTFYLNDEDIKKNLLMVKQFMNQGNLFVIATGRSFLDFKNKVDTYHINYNYVILNHGATILNDKDHIIENFPIENSILKDIKNEIDLDKVIEFFCCSELESRVGFEHTNLTKINLVYNTKEEAVKINQFLNKHYSEHINSYYVTNGCIEIISNQTNKSNAIHLLSKKLNVDKQAIYTIGDGYSDIEMVKDFNGFCMKESVQELKKVAKKQYTSVSELVREIMEQKK